MLHRLLLPLSQNTSKLVGEQLTRALESIPGVVVVFINPQTEMIYLVYRDEELLVEELDTVLKTLGFCTQPRLHSTNLKTHSLQV